MTSYRLLFLFVEGEDDERFFNWIADRYFRNHYDDVKIIKYAQLKTEKISSFIKSIRSMGSDYIFSADINRSPCVTQKKEVINQKIPEIEQNRIVIVIKEIEGWYLAGLTSEILENLQLPTNVPDANLITKEQFDQLFLKRRTSRTALLAEMLDYYNIKQAVRSNHSFAYFYQKFLSD